MSGPSINRVIDPPVTAEEEVLVTVIVFAPVDNIPLVKFRIPFTAVLPKSDTPDELLRVRLLYEKSPTVCELVPLYSTVPVPGVKVPVAAVRKVPPNFNIPAPVKVIEALPLLPV